MFGIAKRKELEKLVAMNMFGIGPRLVLSGGAGVAAVLLLRKFLGGTLHLPTVWTPGLRIAGGILLLIGCWFWFDSARRMVPAFRSRQLATGGVYGLCRNPMYAAFIVFIIPGLALVANEFLILIVALGLYLEFKRNVGREEEFLRREFGAAYAQYARQVPQLFPRIRGGRRLPGTPFSAPE